MNVIVSNKQKDIIDNANIDAIKDLTGLFNVDDLITKFKNYFFSKMILDVTSVENFTSREVLQKLVDGIGSDRLIVLLPQTPPPPNEFKKMLIDLKIYNFSNEISDVVRFIDNPNTLETVMKSLDNDYFGESGYVDNSIKGEEFLNEGMNNDASMDNNPNTNMNENLNTSMNNFNTNNTNSFNDNMPLNSFNSGASLQDALDSFNIKVDGNNTEGNNNSNDNVNIVSNESPSDLYENQNYNFGETYTSDVNEINENNNDSVTMPNLNDLYNSPQDNNNIPNSGESVSYNNTENQNNTDLYSAMIFNSDNNQENTVNNNDISNNNKSGNVFLNIDGINNIGNDGKMVIGFKNVTNHAGSTSLIYMLLKELSNMKKDVIAIEIGKDDFKLFMNNRMVKVEEKDIKEYLSSRYEKTILIDLNNCQDISFCDKVIFLVEPSTIMLNKLMLENRNVFKELSNQSIILNKSMLSNDDANTLSKEAGTKFIYNMGFLNDRVNNSEIVKLIDVLGIK